MVSFGKLAISNPDLPWRVLNQCPLSAWDNDTFYAEGEKGYNDYPTYLEQ